MVIFEKSGEIHSVIQPGFTSARTLDYQIKTQEKEPKYQ